MVSQICGYWVFFNDRFYILLCLTILNKILYEKINRFIITYILVWFTD